MTTHSCEVHQMPARAVLDPVLQRLVVGAIDRRDEAYRTGSASAIRCAEDAVNELRESLAAMREGGQ